MLVFDSVFWHCLVLGIQMTNSFGELFTWALDHFTSWFLIQYWLMGHKNKVSQQQKEYGLLPEECLGLWLFDKLIIAKHELPPSLCHLWKWDRVIPVYKRHPLNMCFEERKYRMQKSGNFLPEQWSWSSGVCLPHRRRFLSPAGTFTQSPYDGKTLARDGFWSDVLAIKYKKCNKNVSMF